MRTRHISHNTLRLLHSHKLDTHLRRQSRRGSKVRHHRHRRSSTIRRRSSSNSMLSRRRSSSSNSMLSRRRSSSSSNSNSLRNTRCHARRRSSSRLRSRGLFLRVALPAATWHQPMLRPQQHHPTEVLTPPPRPRPHGARSQRRKVRMERYPPKDARSHARRPVDRVEAPPCAPAPVRRPRRVRWRKQASNRHPAVRRGRHLHLDRSRRR